MSHIEIVKFLVENGADIRKANQNGGTCLINSVQSTDLCSYLISKGIDVNAKDIQYKTGKLHGMHNVLHAAYYFHLHKFYFLPYFHLNYNKFSYSPTLCHTRT